MCVEREREERYGEGQLAGLIRFSISTMENICGDINKRNPDCSGHIKLMIYDLLPRFNIYMFDDSRMTMQAYAYGRGEDTPTYFLERLAENGLFEYYSSVARQILEQAKPINS